MQTLKANIAAIGLIPGLDEIEYELFSEIEDFKKSPNDWNLVIIGPESDEEAVLQLLKSIRPLDKKFLIDTSKWKVKSALEAFNTKMVIGFFDSKKSQIKKKTLDALEHRAQKTQARELLLLLKEQHIQIESKLALLKSKFSKQRRNLETSKNKLAQATKRLEILHLALIAIQRAKTIGEMERLLTDSLQGILRLNWTRILFQNQSQNFENLKAKLPFFSIFSTPLARDLTALGTIYFGRRKDEPFQSWEIHFLSQIAEMVSLSVDRLSRLEQAEALKHQWEVTFDAIFDPVALIDNQYNLVRFNRAFGRKTNLKIQSVRAEKCYTALFKRTSPCEQCQLGSSFQLSPQTSADGSEVYFNVNSHRVSLANSGTQYVHVYRDLSEKNRLERKILESARLTELGLIGGSIAHELNNPIGGIIAFIQLIKMGLKGSEAYAPDILEMEKGALRCKQIIQNLLEFTRKPDDDGMEPISLNGIIRGALTIIDLQSRSLGIEITFEESETHFIMAQQGALTQAFVNILGSLLQRVLLQKKETGTISKPKIRIKTMALERLLQIVIFDNGRAQQETESEFSVAAQILREHRGQLDLEKSQERENSTTIVLPRLVFSSQNQNFDGEI